MVYKGKPPREIWTDKHTSQDVMNWALARFARLLAQWGVSCIEHDAPAMAERARDIRNIATRMEQFERRQIKRWTAAATAQPKPESTHT